MATVQRAVSLTLDEEEAEALTDVLTRVAGPKGSRYAMIERILNGLVAAGHDVSGSPGDVTGEVRFLEG